MYDLTKTNKCYFFVVMFLGFLVMSLVDDSQAGGNECASPNCGHSGTIYGPGGHSGNIGKDAPLRDITFDDAINFLRQIQDKW